VKTSTSIAYIQGDATRPTGPGEKVIAHVCNDEGKWGKGFVLALSKRWAEPEQQYRVWSAQTPRPKLGEVQFVKVEPEITVANMIGQHGVKRRAAGRPPIRYEAVEEALRKVGEFAASRGASVHMPRIGSGLAGGTWEEVEPIIVRTLTEAGVEVVVYDW
jgi:O-acetyl-ADP-ribose deacetylase (regulator of RNase III)